MYDPKALQLALARATKAHGAKAPETVEARRDYEAAMATAQLAERLTYGGLPFTDSQLDTLAGLIDSARRRAERPRRRRIEDWY
jgi:hypothetical protein